MNKLKSCKQSTSVLKHSTLYLILYTLYSIRWKLANQNRHLKKLIIFLFIVAAIAVTILIVLKVTVNDLKKEDIVENLNKIIEDGSDSLYSLKIRDYEVTGSFNGARINGVEVTINQEIFKKMQANNTLPEVIFDGKVENILIEGINILKLVQDNKDIKIKSIDLVGADFNIYQTKKQSKTPRKHPSSQTFMTG